VGMNDAVAVDLKRRPVVAPALPAAAFKIKILVKTIIGHSPPSGDARVPPM